MYMNAKPQSQTVEQMQGQAQNKSVRVSFEPQVESYDSLTPELRPPALSHHRSQTVNFEGNGHIDVSNSVSGTATPASGQASARIAEPVMRSARPTSTLVRAKSDHWLKSDGENDAKKDDDEDFELRHGWQEEYTSSEYLKILNSPPVKLIGFENFYMYFNEKRHDTGGIPKEQTGSWLQQDWRMRDRLKTVSAALAICLNIGVDPPDVVKTNPSAKLECWVDPTSSGGAQNKVMEQIGKKLQEQYETLSLRTRYKQYLDPSVDETKKFCISLRRNAKDERVLFHYNGHGVPLPTPSAITDTSAWNTLPRALFKKLFRQDLMVAALFRNFLLSERIMRTHECRPISSPELPETHTHPLWQSWDLAVEMVLSQLPALLEHEEGKRHYEYQHSSFFSEQLTAFEVYLSSGPTESNPPDQLPIVLQVLLSQAHRLRALILLSKFLDLGPWAVHLALSIGIFPYVVKLLQSAAQELKPVMVFIWARIMAVDHTVQNDLLKDNGIHYFITILNPSIGIPVGNVSEHRAMCAFIISIFCKEYPQGQNVCLSPELIEFCLHHLMDVENPLLRQWCCLCISMLWNNFAEAKWMGIRCSAPARLCELTMDPVPEVRAAMLHALTSFIGIPDLTDQVAQVEEYLATAIVPMGNDGSALVRRELLVFLSTFVKRYQNKFLVTAYEQLLEEKHLLKHSVSGSKDTQPPPFRDHGVSHNTIYGSLWKLLLILSVDPQEEVAQDAGVVVDYVYKILFDSPVGSLAQDVRDEVLALHRRSRSKKPQPSESVEVKKIRPETPPVQIPSKQEGYLSLSLRRTASVAASLKNLAFGSAATIDQRPSSPLNPSGRQTMAKNRMTITPRGRAPPEWTRPPEVNDQPVSAGQYGQAPTPPSRGVNPRDLTKEPSIPLKSNFLEWSTEYFREPQMKPNEPDEPGSADYNQRLWRRARNERIIVETQQLKDKGGSGRWDVALTLMSNPSQPAKMCFHQFEDHLAVADDRDTICNKNAGLVLDWQQGQGKALIAGDVKVIRVWNAATEVCTNDISARSGSCITSLTSDQVAGNIFIAGFGDGAVRVFDQRLKPTTAMVKVWREHKQWITNVHMQRGGVRELISGSRNGEVRLWDLRMDNSIDTIQATKDTLRTLSVHEHAPVFSIGTNRHEVKTFNVDGSYLSSFEPHGSFLSQSRTSPVVGAAFHPHKMVMACSALYDNYVNLVSC
ncbi:hypothetical protein CIRG_01965 [Coccidioides immitis RMSCC 2394]|uniref:Raptor N-terminal CASPase-like domain-containing protein n=1 Tax=Coccidioides immitis RMSCC 2394 TaxID=404692 RepID=A0A0J6XZR1_COCIT|nr:hypothetical protein CIRG_01965 [Coccidioides immitis RMSCC 2394]